MIRHLAESEHYKVTSEWEAVTLHFKIQTNRKPVCIGDFYGDPACAIISMDEKYIVMAGCGLIVYRLQEPFIEYYYESTNSDQYFEFFRDPPTHWWCNGLHQNDVDGDRRYFRFVAANDEGEFIYKMNAETFEIVQVTS